MRDIIIGVGNYRAMSELVITAAAQYEVLAAVADQAIGGLYATIYTNDAGVRTVVDDALVEGQSWLRCYWRLRNNRLIRISYHGKLEEVLMACLTEIDTRPATGKVTVGIIKPVALKINSCTIKVISRYA